MQQKVIRLKGEKTLCQPTYQRSKVTISAIFPWHDFCNIGWYVSLYVP